MSGLENSVWASARRGYPAPPLRRQHQKLVLNSAPTENTGFTALPMPGVELRRFLKMVARLRWKLPLLSLAYEKASNRIGLPHEDIVAQEAQFKVDFYEFYALIERALVHLMGVFDIRVSGLAVGVKNPIQANDEKCNLGHRSNTMAARAVRPEHGGMHHVLGGPQRGGLSGSVHNPVQGAGEWRKVTQSSSTTAGTGTHQYHENVLRALEDPENPLYTVFGSSEVFRQLARAKELRNRWKKADEYTEDRGHAPAPLGAYNLEQILSTILTAFEHGYEVARVYVESLASAGVLDSDSMSLDEEQDADAMEWETC